EGLIRPLQDPLRTDVDPAARGHLAEHRQAERLESPELVPGRPLRDEQRVRDQHAGRSRMRTEDADRLAALDEQGLVLPEPDQRAHDRLQGVVAARGPAGAAVHDQLLRPLRHLAVEVVEEHPQRRLRRPGTRRELAAARRADRRQVAAERVDRRRQRLGRAHRSTPTSSSTAATSEPSRIAAATASISPPSGRSSVRRGDSPRTNARAAAPPRPGSSGARNSTPWTPASSSIAKAHSAFASTCQAFKPAAFPIETWSSWPALVGIESTLAGCASTLFSLTSDAATYCGIMNPELSPPSVVRKGGSPPERLGLTSRSTRRSAIFASSATAIA